MVRKPLACVRALSVLLLCLVLLLAGLPAGLAARELKPGVIYALGEKFDRSFNESAHQAHEQFARDRGIAFLEYHPAQLSELPRGIDSLVRRGANHITLVGFYYAQPLQKLAPTYPDVHFTLIDAPAQGDNIRSVLFREQEGSFLVGMLAAMASQSHKIGFVAAMDIPLLRKFIFGFEQGARFVSPDIVYSVRFVAATPAGFNDPTTAGELARSLFSDGADVVFAGAGNSNMGVFQAAFDAGRYAIGVDSNQNALYPGTILTSMLKRVDVAVRDSLEDDLNEKWTPGVRSLGLAEGGVGWALDDNNRALITKEMTTMTQHANAAIVDGSLIVLETPPD